MFNDVIERVRSKREEDIMKTLGKTILTMTGLLLIAGCAAVAEETAPTVATPAPGWRHEQMVKAWQTGEVAPAPMMMRGRGYGYGYGHQAMMRAAIGPDGKIDPAKLPAGCPYAAQVPAAATVK